MFCWLADRDYHSLHDIIYDLKKKLTGQDMEVHVDQRSVVVKALTIYKDRQFDL